MQYLVSPVNYTCTHSIFSCSWVKIGGSVYKKDAIVAVSSSLLPIFGQILAIVMLNVNQCYFVCEILATDSFNSHYHSYEVRKQEFPTPVIVCRHSALIDHHVLSLYHVSTFNFISLKYYIPENIEQQYLSYFLQCYYCYDYAKRKTYSNNS